MEIQSQSMPPRCAICFEKAESSLLVTAPLNAPLQNDDSPLKMISCQICRSWFHRCCYGVANIKSEADFLCDKCIKKKSKVKSCFLCGQSEGYLRKLMKNKYLHPICGLCRGLEITDFETMKFALNEALDQMPEAGQGKCMYCGLKEGLILKCSVCPATTTGMSEVAQSSAKSTSHEQTHPYCAFAYKLNSLTTSQNEEHYWSIQLMLQNSWDKPRSHYFPEIYKYIHGDPSEFIEKLKRAKGEEKEDSQAVITRRSSRLKEKQKGGNGGNCLRKLENCLKVLCDIHKVTGCRACRKDNPKAFWVACDSCESWYHGECVGIESFEEANKNAFICDRCKFWQEETRDVFNEMKATSALEQGDYEKVHEWPKQLYDEDNLEMEREIRVTDMLVMALLWEKRAKILMKHCARVELLYATIVDGMRLPVNTRGMCMQLKDKLEEGIIWEIGIEKEIKITDLIKSGLNEKFEILPESLQTNQNVLANIAAINNKYFNTIKIATKQFGDAGQIMRFLQLLTEFHAKLKQGFLLDFGIQCLTQFETMHKLLEMKEQLFEIAFLKERIAEYRNWEAKIKDVKECKESQIIEEVEKSNEEDVKKQISAINEHCQELLVMQGQKLPLSVYIQLLDEGEKLYLQNPSKLNELRAFYASAQAYINFFKNELIKSDHFAFLAQVKQMIKLPINSEEMTLSIKLYGKMLRWKLVIDKIRRQGEIISETTGELLKPKELLTLDDLQSLLSSAKDIDHLLPGPTLSGMLSCIQTWVTTFQMKFEHEFEIPNLHFIADSLLQIVPIKNVPQLLQLQDRIELLTEMSASINSASPILIESLYSLLKKGQERKFPERVLRPIIELVEKGEKYIQAINSVVNDLNNTNYTKDTITSSTDTYNTSAISAISYYNKDSIEKLYALLKELNQSKVIVPGKAELIEVEQSYNWYKAAIEVIGQNLNMLEQVPNPALINLKLSGEKLAKGPSKGLLINIKQVLWAKTARIKLESGSKMELGELESLLKEMKELNITSDHAKFGELSRVASKALNDYREVVQEYEKIINLSVENCTEEQLRQLKSLAFTSQVSMNEVMSNLRKKEVLVGHYKALKAIMEESLKIPADKFTSIYEGYLNTCENTNELPAIVKQAEIELKEYKKWHDYYMAYRAGKKSPSIMMQEKTAVDLKAAAELIEVAKKLRISLESEAKEIEDEILMHKDKYEKLNHLSEMPENEMMSLLNSIQVLPIYPKAQVYSILAIKWEEKAKRFIDPTIFSQQKEATSSDKLPIKKMSIEDWNDIMREREKLLMAQTADDKYKEILRKDWIEKMASQLREGLSLIKQISDLRRKDSSTKLNYDDAKLMLELLKNSPVELSQEIQFMSETIQKANQLTTDFSEMKLKKATVYEYEKLLNTITENCTSISLDIEKDLREIINRSNTFITNLKQIANEAIKAKEKLKKSKVELLLQQYAGLCSSVDEAEILQKQYNDSLNMLKSCRESLIKNRNCCELDEINRIAKTLSSIPINMEEDGKEIKADFWRAKFNLFIKNSEQLVEKPKLGALKALAQEYDDIGILTDDMDTININKLKQIIEEANENIVKINKTEDLKKLDEFEKQLVGTLAGNIDYSEYIIEQQTRLSMALSSISSSKESIQKGVKRSQEEQTDPSKQSQEISSYINDFIVHDPGNLPLGFGGKIIYQQAPKKEPEPQVPVSPDTRTKIKTKFEQIISANAMMGTKPKVISKLAQSLEKDLFGEIMTSQLMNKEKAINARAENAARNLQSINSYPLLSGFIADGKLQLWKLCKIMDLKKLEQKMKNIEAILTKKKKKAAESNEGILNREARRNLLSDEPEEGDNASRSLKKIEGASSKYDPLMVASTGILPGRVKKAKDIASSSISGAETQKGKQFEDDAASANSVEFGNQGGNDNDAPKSKSAPYDPLMIATAEDIQAIKQPMSDTSATQKALASSSPKSLTSSQGLSGSSYDLDTQKKPHQVQKTNLIPIAYDPSMPEHEASSSKMLLTKDQAPTGSLLKIWSGKLENGKIVVECEMRTTDNIDHYMNFPMLAPQIVINGRARIREVVQYITHCKTTVAEFLVLPGWITALQASIDPIQSYTLELEKADKCGVIDIKEMNSHIYLLPNIPHYIAELFDSCSFHPKADFMGQSAVKLIYFITFKKRDSIGMFKAIQPVLLQKYEKPAEKELLADGVEVISEDENDNNEEISTAARDSKISQPMRQSSQPALTAASTTAPADTQIPPAKATYNENVLDDFRAKLLLMTEEQKQKAIENMNEEEREKMIRVVCQLIEKEKEEDNEESRGEIVHEPMEKEMPIMSIKDQLNEDRGAAMNLSSPMQINRIPSEDGAVRANMANPVMANIFGSQSIGMDPYSSSTFMRIPPLPAHIRQPVIPPVIPHQVAPRQMFINPPINPAFQQRQVMPQVMTEQEYKVNVDRVQNFIEKHLSYFLPLLKTQKNKPENVQFVPPPPPPLSARPNMPMMFPRPGFPPMPMPPGNMFARFMPGYPSAKRQY